MVCLLKKHAAPPEIIKLGVSSCLISGHVRYDGADKCDRYVKETLARYFTLVGVCPEVEYGLPVPREAMRLTGNPESPRLVTVRTRIDHTAGMRRWTQNKLRVLGHEDICGFIFKSRSPSSGIRGVRVYSEDGRPAGRGAGIFGGAFIRRFPLIPVIDEVGLYNQPVRENFFERVFACHRWKELLRQKKNIKNLVSFHARHKLLIMSHSRRHLSALGRLVADSKKYQPGELFARYIRGFMEGLTLLATVRKNTDVLFHILGYFKRRLSSDDRQELLTVIEKYHEGGLPLIVPVVLINHHVRKLNEPYLKQQYYLNPHPSELMLRNHI